MTSIKDFMSSHGLTDRILNEKITPTRTEDG